jgi:hypothetical protein
MLLFAQAQRPAGVRSGDDSFPTDHSAPALGVASHEYDLLIHHYYYYMIHTSPARSN